MDTSEGNRTRKNRSVPAVQVRAALRARLVGETRDALGRCEAAAASDFLDEQAFVDLLRDDLGVLPAERRSCPLVLALLWPSRGPAPAVQRCKNQQHRCSYGRDRPASQVPPAEVFREDAKTVMALCGHETLPLDDLAVFVDKGPAAFFRGGALDGKRLRLPRPKTCHPAAIGRVVGALSARFGGKHARPRFAGVDEEGDGRIGVDAFRAEARGKALGLSTEDLDDEDLERLVALADAAGGKGNKVFEVARPNGIETCLDRPRGNRGDAAGAAWIVRGRWRRGCRADRPRAATPRAPRGSSAGGGAAGAALDGPRWIVGLAAAPYVDRPRRST